MGFLKNKNSICENFEIYIYIFKKKTLIEKCVYYFCITIFSYLNIKKYIFCIITHHIQYFTLFGNFYVRNMIITVFLFIPI